mmetsp:Transcript_34846/g.93080  ORF Transcript_34846/g.93080 Transcript_34846/m.93080 type:complete len:266 (+) Transcript_34846:3003-3800(+)
MSSTFGALGISMKSEFTKKARRRLASWDTGSASFWRTARRPCSLRTTLRVRRSCETALTCSVAYELSHMKPFEAVPIRVRASSSSFACALMFASSPLLTTMPLSVPKRARSFSCTWSRMGSPKAFSCSLLTSRPSVLSYLVLGRENLALPVPSTSTPAVCMARLARPEVLTDFFIESVESRSFDPRELPMAGLGERERLVRLVRTGFLARLFMPLLRVLTIAITEALMAVTCSMRMQSNMISSSIHPLIISITVEISSSWAGPST